MDPVKILVSAKGEGVVQSGTVDDHRDTVEAATKFSATEANADPPHTHEHTHNHRDEHTHSHDHEIESHSHTHDHETKSHSHSHPKVVWLVVAFAVFPPPPPAKSHSHSHPKVVWLVVAFVVVAAIPPPPPATPIPKDVDTAPLLGENVKGSNIVNPFPKWK